MWKFSSAIHIHGRENLSNRTWLELEASGLLKESPYEDNFGFIHRMSGYFQSWAAKQGNDGAAASPDEVSRVPGIQVRSIPPIDATSLHMSAGPYADACTH